MVIIIKNISEGKDNISNSNKYSITINKTFVCQFTHDNCDGISGFLNNALKAVESEDDMLCIYESFKNSYLKEMVIIQK